MSEFILNQCYLIPLFPLIAVLINGLFGRKYFGGRSPIVHYISCGAIGLSFLWAIPTFIAVTQLPEGHKIFEKVLYNWIVAGEFNVSVGFQIDPLSAIMIMVVTTVGFLIHIYSIGYVADEKVGYYRFFTYLSLFTFAMLILVMGNNFLMMFVGWEGVGLCSYLLIGYWFHKKSASDAGKKAFIVNRIGDFGFTLGVMLIFATTGTLDYTEVFSKIHNLESIMILGLPAATLAALLLFVGACGKSAQIPLYVWLPDAMEGPTPVSALIHAATMVTAGVYMVTRCNVIFTTSELAMTVVATIGILTAVFAATIGLVQNDIKRVLAYSTVSQLGYMFAGLGVGAFSAGIFHLYTHAFFKGLLFLGSGSVILAMHHEQNIQKMGGLRKHIPKTYWTFLIATLAIAGIPPFAGFWSKDEILWGAFSSGNYFVWTLGAIGAFITAFYMFRLVFITFFGELRTEHHSGHNSSHNDTHSTSHNSTHNSSHDTSHSNHNDHHSNHHSNLPDKEIPEHITDAGLGDTWLKEFPVMTIPLMILAFFSAVAGFINIPEVIAKPLHLPSAWFHHFLSPVIGGGHHGTEVMEHSTHSGGLELLMMLVSVLIASAGIFTAWIFYIKKPSIPLALGKSLKPIYTLLLNKYYVDEIYALLIINPIKKLCEILSAFDKWIIDGLVNLVRHITVIISWLSDIVDIYIVDGILCDLTQFIFDKFSLVLRRIQTGRVQNYALLMLVGIVTLMVYWIYWMM